MSLLVPKVLIVGAGPSGLIAALTLLQNGVPVRIIAKEQSYRPGQRGSGISARTMEIYKFLGVDEVLQKAIFNYDVLEHARGSPKVNNVVRMITWAEPTPSCPWRTYLMMGQNSAEEILRSHLAKYGCAVELGTALSTFKQDSERITAVLTKSVNGKEHTETIDVDWLIGADGARGVTRKALGLTFLGETTENQNMVIGDVHIRGLSTDGWHNYGERSSILLIIKPGEKLDKAAFQFFIMGPDVDHVKLSSDTAALLEFFAEQSGLPREAFGDVVWAADYNPKYRMVNKLAEGRCFVVGDAAHVHSPMGGQGMNSSIQDSFNLAWKLSLVAKGHAPATLLQSYNDERLPVIAAMLNISKALQNTTSDPQSETPWARSAKLLQLGVNYRGSSIVIDEIADGADGVQPTGDSYTMDGTLRGGDRAPDAPNLLDTRSQNGLATARFFDIFKPYTHTVLIFSSAAATPQCTAVLRALQQYPEGIVQSVVVNTFEVYRTGDAGLELATIVLKDNLGHAYEGYAVAPRAEVITVYIIRPDGVVGALVRGVEGVEKYFSGILQ
ncbi:hypothetical protein FIBSPDRAFT_855330 [Athelia psychrophila]|uniref:FAD-binding domain-containing protein n=1 Tax=Athelia psychrophila TaxID=1759441 RepID=A0A166PFP0_9AGAM|nr:hypothetical protein FIBSPDRAFT_855330 [Fibularhizoctonia sp. CBS 109695]